MEDTKRHFDYVMTILYERLRQLNNQRPFHTAVLGQHAYENPYGHNGQITEHSSYKELARIDGEISKCNTAIGVIDEARGKPEVNP